MPTKPKTLVDTNIFIYSYDATSIYHKKVVRFLNDPSFDLYTPTKNISEFFAVLSKLGQPFPKVFSFYQNIKSNTGLLFPNTSSLSIFEILLQKYEPKGNKVYDMEIVSIALDNRITEISTVNVKDFAGISEIKVRTI